jgi:hypothetical protein
MKYLKKFNEEISSEEKAKRTSISNFPHIAKEESEKKERIVKRSQKEDPDGMYPRDDKRYDDDSSSSDSWQDGMGKPSWLGEGKLMKSKSVDTDVKKESFRKKVEDYIKSQDCKVKQVGDDFEVHFEDDKLAQVMFRDDYMSVKKVGSKFPKEFKYNEFGKLKSELSSIIKSNK